MPKLPAAVAETMKRLKEGNSHYLSVKAINGRLYVYESTTKWDSGSRKVRSISRYLGRMTPEGRFIPGIKRDAELGFTGNEAVFNARVEGVSEGSGRRKAEARPYSSGYEAQVLEQLSQDARLKTATLARRLGLSYQGALFHRNGVEAKYGISRLPELDLGLLGFSECVVMAKFMRDVPGTARLRSVLEKEESVQLALAVQGDYDLILYCVFRQGSDIGDEIRYLRGRLFPDQELRLSVSPFRLSHGFIPLRRSFFGAVRRKGSGMAEEAAKAAVSRREAAFLGSISADAPAEFSEIDAENGFGAGSSRYLYARLIEKGILRRVTASATAVPLRYLSVILLEELSHGPFEEAREYLAGYAKSAGSGPVERFSAVGRAEGLQSLMFIMPVFSDYDLDAAMEGLRKVRGARLTRLIATDVIVGSLCYRRMPQKV